MLILTARALDHLLRLSGLRPGLGVCLMRPTCEGHQRLLAITRAQDETAPTLLVGSGCKRWLSTAILTHCSSLCLLVVDFRIVASENNISLLTQSPPASSTHLNDRRSANLPLHVPESSSTAPTQQIPQSMSTFGVHRHGMSSPNLNYQKALDGIIAALPNPSNTTQASSFPREESIARPTILSVTSEDEILALAEILMADPANHPTSIPYDSSPRPTEYPASYTRSERHLSASSRRSAGSSYPTSPNTPLLGSEDLHYDDYADSLHLPQVQNLSLSGQFPLPASRLRPISDVPSLTTSETYSSPTLSTPPLSRTSSVAQLNSTSISPSSAFLPTPTEPVTPNVALAVIHESGFSEDAFSVEEAIHDIQNNLTLGVEEVARQPVSSKEPAVATRPRPPVLEIQTSTAGSIKPGSTSSVSPVPTRGFSDETLVGSPIPSSKGGAFTRLFKGNKDADVSVLPIHLPNDLKAAKQEEKRRQKQMAKERRDRLAREFQAIAKGQTLSDDGSTTSSEKKRRKTPWEEESGGIYNSFSFV